MSKWRRLIFWLAYLQGRAPWDTNVTPPELVRSIEGPDALTPGRALDLGCGTGTNAIYMARHGWDAIGVDFVGQAINQARKRAQAADVAHAARFYSGDVTRLGGIKGLNGSFDLVLDIGCLHSLDPQQWTHYAAGLVDRLCPGGTFLLYAWERHLNRNRKIGISLEQIEATFAPDLNVMRVERGKDHKQSSAWYWLVRG